MNTGFVVNILHPSKGRDNAGVPGRDRPNAGADRQPYAEETERTREKHPQDRFLPLQGHEQDHTDNQSENGENKKC